MSDALSRLRLPLLLGSLMLLVGGSKLDSVRPLEGQIVALLVPLIAVSSGVSPFRDAHSSLRNWVFALGALVLVLAELGPYRVVFEDTVAAPALGITLLLLLALLLAVVFEVAGAQRGLRSRPERLVWARDRVRALLPCSRGHQQPVRQRVRGVLDRSVPGRGSGLVPGRVCGAARAGSSLERASSSPLVLA